MKDIWFWQLSSNNPLLFKSISTHALLSGITPFICNESELSGWLGAHLKKKKIKNCFNLNLNKCYSGWIIFIWALRPLGHCQLFGPLGDKSPIYK